MNRHELERYSLIAQIIDEVEQDVGIDFYIYSDVITEKVKESQYRVNIIDEGEIVIDFNSNEGEHETSVDAVFTSAREDYREHYSWYIDYNHGAGNHIMLVTDEG